MESLSTKKKSAIIRCYLSGLSYNEIAVQENVSTGTVSNMVTDLKVGKFPEQSYISEQIDQLRELSVDLKHSNISPGQCMAGLGVLNLINKYGLDPADINRWSTILKSVKSEEEIQEFVRLVDSIQVVQKKTGLGLEDLDDKVHELEKEANNLAPMRKQYKKYHKQLTEQSKQRENLNKEIGNLEQKYNFLNPRVKDMEKREGQLSQRIQAMEKTSAKAEKTIATLNTEKQRILNIGFSLESLGEFNQRVQIIAKHHKFTVPDLRDRLLNELENLDTGLGLERLIQNQQMEVEQQKQALATAKQSSESLSVVVADLTQEKTNLEASIQGIKEKVCQELTHIAPAARNTINQLVEELQRGHGEILAEIRQMKNEALEVGTEVGKYYGLLQSNPWLNELLSLVRGEDGIEGKRVKVITLLILRGTAAWLKNREINTVLLTSMSYSIENLIKELEQWKI